MVLVITTAVSNKLSHLTCIIIAVLNAKRAMVQKKKSGPKKPTTASSGSVAAKSSSSSSSAAKGGDHDPLSNGNLDKHNAGAS